MGYIYITGLESIVNGIYNELYNGIYSRSILDG